MFFSNISYKIWVIWMKCHKDCFLNKFATKWCKRLPPHVNNVSTLPCETWNAHRTCAANELLQEETPEFIPPQLCLPDSPDLNPVDNSMWEILQEQVYKTRITDLEPSTMPLINGCRNDDIIQLGLLHSYCCLSSFRSVMRILYTFSGNTPKCCNQLGAIGEVE